MGLRFTNLADRDPAMVKLAQQVAARLEGYGGGGEDVESILEKLDYDPNLRDPALNDSFCDELDRLVFCCTVCEYWFAQSENANPGYTKPDPWMCKGCKREGN